ncbi:SGNH/GDSL hydrolase family protein [Nocardioides zeae]|uniref:SGNH/GDSL hydrolase family protein n=1 Tax=Nocardioides imazamoxiresistens TaxID=3231893 RepID=A0ABU3PRU6_9ACTN|nr:SGNH/GDSL hydrolase family protein [Nocardioides zeae]MDT9591950.1 SGNH/GDSL hydrolase family protein [Nocardioides zeae]
MTAQGGNDRSYLRFAAVGDSTTVGVGDPMPGTPAGLGAGATGRDGTWRGWATLLARALEESYDVSFCNVAVSGATARDVVAHQLSDATDHRADLVSLVVGLNDTMRSTWSPQALRADLLLAAERLTARGALLMTARFHDHGEVLGLPGLLRRPMQRRIEVVNEVYDEVHATHGGVRVDLAACPAVHERGSWSIDRMHPSERGHRALARAFAEQLAAAGLDVVPPAAEPDAEQAVTWREDVGWVVTEAVPWVGRRVRDLAPWAVRAAWQRVPGVPAGGVPAASAAGGHHDRVAVGDGDGVLAVRAP